MGKHSGNMAGGSAVDAEIQRTISKQIDAAAKDAAPCIGYSLRGNKNTGAMELVIAGQHKLSIGATAIVLDVVNALLLASMIADGVAQGMIDSAKAMAQLGDKPKVD